MVRSAPTNLGREEYLERWGRGLQCLAFLRQAHFDREVRCNRCGSIDWKGVADPGQLRCRKCRTHLSLKAGTAFENSRIDLSAWFELLWLMSVSRGGMTTKFAANYLGLPGATIWAMRRRIFEHISALAAQERFCEKPKAILCNVVVVNRLSRAVGVRAKKSHCVIICDGTETFFVFTLSRSRTALQDIVFRYCDPFVEIVTVGDHSAEFMQAVRLNAFHQFRYFERVSSDWNKVSLDALRLTYGFQYEIRNMHVSISMKYAQNYFDDYLVRMRNKDSPRKLFDCYLRLCTKRLTDHNSVPNLL